MPTTWSNVSTSATSWTNVHHDLKNIWGEWESVTWGAIESATGLTWAGMAGNTFLTTTAGTTTWTTV